MSKPLALVTGGSRGIGRAIVERLLKEDYEVLNFSRHPAAQSLSGETFESVDLMSPAATSQAIEHWSDKREMVHLVNNAGMIHVAALEEVTPLQVQEMVNLNLMAPMLLTQALVPAMKRQGQGRVVNIGSRAGWVKRVAPSTVPPRPA